MEKMWALAQTLTSKSLIANINRSLEPSSPKSPKLCRTFKLVDEIPHFPTVVLDLDGTLIHTLVQPAQKAAAQRSDLRTIQLPGKRGLVVERPGLQQLFAALQGYNVVVYSAGGFSYVNIVVEKLLEAHPIMQGKICKVLCQSDLVKYSTLSEEPSDTPLTTDGVYYVKDLRKARDDGNLQKVLIIDDNPYAFQVYPFMKDADFERRYDFTLNALSVSEFKGTDPNAVLDTAFDAVTQLLKEISSEDDIVAALKDHPHGAALMSL